MTSHTHDLKNPRFCNWVKGGTALRYFTKGLRSFVDRDLQALHGSLRTDIQTKLRSLNGGSDICNECSVFNVLPCYPVRTCENGKDRCKVHTGVDSLHKPAICGKGTCKLFFDKIRDYHQSRKPSWRNTTAQKWNSDPIEIGKCFLSECEPNRRIQSIDDVDTIGLLDILENNKHIWNTLSFSVKSPNNALYKCKLVRKAVFHTENFELSDADIDGFIKDLIELLEDRKWLCKDTEAKTAVLKLKQLANMTVTLQDETEVREEVLKQIQSEKAQAAATVQDEQAKAVNLLRRDLEENIKDVNDRNTSLSLSMFAMRDDFEAMGLKHTEQFRSLTDTQERIKHNLVELSKNVKGEVKEMIVQTLDELKSENAPTNNAVEEPQNIDKVQEHLNVLEKRVDILEQILFDDSNEFEERRKLQSFNSMRMNLVKFEKLEQLHKQDMECRNIVTDYMKRKSSLQDELCSKYAKRRANVNIPFNSEIHIDVTKIHTEQTIQPINMLGTTRIDVASDTVIGYKKILSTDGKVVLLGDVGTGKTIYCYKLLQDWVKAVRKVKSSRDASLVDDERFLSKFSFVFYIELENASEEYSVIDMICRQIFGSSTDMFKDGHNMEYKTILEVFYKEPSECLIILDGLDKWNPTVYRKGLHNKNLPIQPLSSACSTLLTCRHWKWHDILHSLSEADIDGTYQVCGLAKETEAVESLVSVFSEEVNPGKDEKLLFDEFESLSSEPMMSETMKVPSILHFCVWTLFSCDSNKESKTELISRVVVHLFEYMCSWKVDRPMDHSSTKNTELLDSMNLPEPFINSDVMGRYCIELSKIALLAFKDLVNTADRSPLIFTEQGMKKYFLKDELDICFKTGVLTQERVAGCKLQKTVQLSFLCSSLQQYFAALHLAIASSRSESQAVDELLEFCSEEDRVHKMEDFLHFVFCFVPSLRMRLTESICKKLPCDSNSQGPSDRMKFLLLKCLKEVDAYNKNTPQDCSFYIDSIRLSFDDFKDDQKELALRLYQSNAHNLKHLVALCDAVESNTKKISVHIFSSLMNATALASLDLRDVVLTDGGVAFTYLTSLKTLSLTRVTSSTTAKEVINLTYAPLQLLTCRFLENLEITFNSSTIQTISMRDCQYVQLKTEPQTGFFNLNLSQKVDLGTPFLMTCQTLKNCVIDFRNASMNLSCLVMNGCSECKLFIDENQVEEDDKESSNNSVVYNYLSDVSKLWTDSTSTYTISSIQMVRVTNCRHIKIEAFTIVSNVLVENCTAFEMIFQSNVKDKDAFCEISEANKSPMCLETVEVKNVQTELKGSFVHFLNMPLQLISARVSDCCDCGIMMNCFDVNMAFTIAESYFTDKTANNIQLQNERTVHLNHARNVELFLKSTQITLNSAIVEFCEKSTLTLVQSLIAVSLLDQVDTPSEDVSLSEVSLPHVALLKCTQVSDVSLRGLQEAVIRQVILESCDLTWTDIQWRMVQNLHIDSVTDSSAYICQTLRESDSLQNITFRQLNASVFNSIQTLVPTLPHLKSLDLGQNGEGMDALIHSLTVCGKLTSLKCSKIDHTEKLTHSGKQNSSLGDITDQTISVFIETLPKLEHLKDLECSGMSEKALIALQMLGKKLNSLENFTLSQCEISEHSKLALKCISMMPKLKRLACRDISTDFLSVLQKLRLKHIDTFEAGPFTDKLHPEHLKFLLNAPKLKKHFTIICNGLNFGNFKLIMNTVGQLKSTTCVEIQNMTHMDKETLCPTGNLKRLVCRHVKSGFVATILDSVCGTHLECLHLENVDSVDNEPRPVCESSCNIDVLKFSRVSVKAMEDLMGMFEHVSGVTCVDLSFLALNKTLTEHLQKLKTLKELKLQRVLVRSSDLESLERCVGILDVEELTLSDVSFQGLSLDLSNAYRLRIINLTNVYMDSTAWINSFKKLPKLLDARERGIVSEEFILVDVVERKHSTSVRKIKLQNVCITGEAIRVITDIAQFPHADWTCVRKANPTIYNADLRASKKKK